MTDADRSCRERIRLETFPESSKEHGKLNLVKPHHKHHSIGWKRNESSTTTTGTLSYKINNISGNNRMTYEKKKKKKCRCVTTAHNGNKESDDENRPIIFNEEKCICYFTNCRHRDNILQNIFTQFKLGDDDSSDENSESSNGEYVRSRQAERRIKAVDKYFLIEKNKLSTNSFIRSPQSSSVAVVKEDNNESLIKSGSTFFKGEGIFSVVNEEEGLMTSVMKEQERLVSPVRNDRIMTSDTENFIRDSSNVDIWLYKGNNDINIKDDKDDVLISAKRFDMLPRFEKESMMMNDRSLRRPHGITDLATPASRIIDRNALIDVGRLTPSSQINLWHKKSHSSISSINSTIETRVASLEPDSYSLGHSPCIGEVRERMLKQIQRNSQFLPRDTSKRKTVTLGLSRACKSLTVSSQTTAISIVNDTPDTSRFKAPRALKRPQLRKSRDQSSDSTNTERSRTDYQCLCNPSSKDQKKGSKASKNCGKDKKVAKIRSGSFKNLDTNRLFLSQSDQETKTNSSGSTSSSSSALNTGSTELRPLTRDSQKEHRIQFGATTTIESENENGGFSTLLTGRLLSVSQFRKKLSSKDSQRDDQVDERAKLPLISIETVERIDSIDINSFDKKSGESSPEFAVFGEDETFEEMLFQPPPDQLVNSIADHYDAADGVIWMSQSTDVEHVSRMNLLSNEITFEKSGWLNGALRPVG